MAFVCDVKHISKRINQIAESRNLEEFTGVIIVK